MVHTPVPMALYGTLATVMVGTGLVMSAFLCVYQATTTQYSRQLPRELAMAGATSVLLGLGTLFTLLWTGVFV